MGFVSAIITAYNSQKTVGFTIDSIISQTMLPDEIIIVNDGSTDKTINEINKKKKAIERKGIKLVLINQKNKGIAYATNVAIKKAKWEFIVSVDSDAILKNDFIEKALKQFKDKKVGITAGYIGISNPKSFWARVMGYNLEYRYDHIFGKKDKAEVDHVSPCNTIYRKELFKKIGYFDPNFHYAQDNDFSYRAKNAGYKIILLKNTGCTHFWRDDFKSYIKQQFNVAYGRMRLISKYKEKAGGDKVTGFRQFMQVPLTGLLVLTFLIGLFFNQAWWIFLVLLFVYLIERTQETAYIVSKYHDFSMILLPAVQFFRNLAWADAFIAWIIKRK